MHSEPRKIGLFTGLVVSTVAIAAYVSQAGRHWLPPDEFSSARSDAPSYRARGDMISGTVIPAPADAPAVASGVAGRRPQAARDSLQRNDLGAAQAQPDAVPSVQQNDGQAGTATAAGVGKTPAVAAKPVRLSSAAEKHGHSRASRFASREETRRASGDASSRGALDKLMARLNSNSARHVRGPAAAASATASANATRSMNDAPVAEPAPLVARAAQETPVVVAAPTAPAAPAVTTAPSLRAEPQAALSAQATVSSPSAMESNASVGTVVKTDGGPKTRAQVRAEIVRARQNGSLPPFGNPDPAGPGGAPSLTGATRP